MSTKAFVTTPKTPLAPIRALGGVCARNYLSRLSLSTSLGSANDFNDVVALEALSVGDISNFSPNGRCFRRLVRGRPAIVGSRRPKKAQSPPSRHRCLLIK